MDSRRKKRTEETPCVRSRHSQAPDEKMTTANRSHPHAHPNEAQDGVKKQTVRNSTRKRDTKNARSVHPEELGIQLKRKLAITSGFPSRPGEGTLGKRIKLLSNCFPIKFPSGNVYHYDVSIIQKRKNVEEEKSTSLLPAGAGRDERKYRCLSTKRNREIVAHLLDNHRVFDGVLAAYDGKKNLYARREIRADFPVKCEVILPDENEPLDERRQNVFEVQVKPVNKTASASCAVSLDSLHALYEGITSSVPGETIMAIETILRHGPCLRFTPIGRSFFSPDPRNLHPLGGGLEIWFGHHQSVRLGQWKPFVNLDITATAFYQKGPLLAYVAEHCLNTRVEQLRRRFLQNTEIKRISNKLKNMRVAVNHLRYPRKYRIVRLVKESANRLEFDLVENGQVVKRTIANYFRERYGRRLEFPNLPCLQVYPENKKTYLPLEVCDIVEGQHCKRKLDSNQTSRMIQFTAIHPQERFQRIEDIVQKADFNSDRVVRGFGIEVSQNPLGVEGRVLDPPNLWYKDGYKVKPKDGSWHLTQFLRGAEIKAWVLLSFANISPRDLERFSELFQSTAIAMGMSLNNPELLEIINPSRCDMKKVLSDMKIKYKAALAILVVPVSEKLLYSKIKQAAEISVGLVTQCIKESNVTNPKKCNIQLVRNLCQKINAKMGGENNTLEHGVVPRVILEKPAIVIGADVNHPGPSTGLKPSIAACVGSLDSRLSRFAVSVRTQPNINDKKQVQEIILDLKDMVKELLKAFYKHTGKQKPEKIIFYRDGVSEGQFDQVRDKELRDIRLACREIDENYEPGITFIVVQKRHHVRFRPQDPRDGVGKMLNVPPGTTVDTVVTSPVNFDYYLCSHFGLKGTSRPAHYTVLEDDNDFSADDIQKFTYQLCHTYARCTRSISIPVPVAYADLAAYRARHHLDSAMEDATSSSDSSSGSGGSGSSLQLTEAVKEAVKVIPELRNLMYFV